jgi:hypothetical protein
MNIYDILHVSGKGVSRPRIRTRRVKSTGPIRYRRGRQFLTARSFIIRSRELGDWRPLGAVAAAVIERLSETTQHRRDVVQRAGVPKPRTATQLSCTGDTHA